MTRKRITNRGRRTTNYKITKRTMDKHICPAEEQPRGEAFTIARGAERL